MSDKTSFNPSSLSGRRVLVTGTSSGLGLAIMQSCVRMGTELIVIERDQTRLNGCLITLQSTLELSHHAVQADPRIAEERIAVVAVVDSEIHGLVRGANISRLCPVRIMAEAHLHEIQSINADSPMLLTQALLRRNLVMPGDSTLFIASVAAHIRVAGVGTYSRAGAALTAMSRRLTIEVMKCNIRVNCLSPSLMETSLLNTAARTVGSMDGQRSSHSVGFGRPEGIINAVIFILSGASHRVAGMTLVMSGGLTIS